MIRGTQFGSLNHRAPAQHNARWPAPLAHGCFRSKADINWQAGSVGSVENDPLRPIRDGALCSAAIRQATPIDAGLMLGNFDYALPMKWRPAECLNSFGRRRGNRWKKGEHKCLSQMLICWSCWWLASAPGGYPESSWVLVHSAWIVGSRTGFNFQTGGVVWWIDAALTAAVGAILLLLAVRLIKR